MEVIISILIIYIAVIIHHHHHHHCYHQIFVNCHYHHGDQVRRCPGALVALQVVQEVQALPGPGGSTPHGGFVPGPQYSRMPGAVFDRFHIVL